MGGVFKKRGRLEETFLLCKYKNIAFFETEDVYFVGEF